MKIDNPIKKLTKFEWALWLISIAAVGISAAVSFSLFPDTIDWLTLAASLIGVTSLVFLSKADVWGQILSIAFNVTYALAALNNRFFGETIIYFCLHLPIAVFTLTVWLRNRFKKEDTVIKIAKTSPVKTIIVCFIGAAVTVGAIFLLRYLDTDSLALSTVSVFTSFVALSLMVLRSPYYALVYAANDVVLIILWTISAVASPANAVMVACFIAYLANDLYALYNWRRIRRAQKTAEASETPSEEN